MALQDTLEQLKNFDANDIDFERIGVWPLPAKILVIVLLASLVFGLTYYLKIGELKEDLASSEAKELTLRKTYETKSFEAANLDAYKAQMQEMDETFKSLLSRLPAKSEEPGLIEDIESRARESGLTIVSTTIDPEKTTEYYNEVPIRIVVEGGYHDLGGFVSGVAGMTRIVTLHDYNIGSRKQNSVLTMQISAKTYRYKTQEK